MLKPVAFTSLMPSLAWLASVVISPSSLLVCGSSPEATLLEAQVSLFLINKSRCLIGVWPNQFSMMCGESSAGDIVRYVLVFDLQHWPRPYSLHLLRCLLDVLCDYPDSWKRHCCHLWEYPGRCWTTVRCAWHLPHHLDDCDLPFPVGDWTS